MSDENENAHLYTPMGMVFEGAPDKNMKLNWLGPLPRVGEHLVLRGRDKAWLVDRVEWHLDPQLKESRLERAVKVYLVEAPSKREMN